MSVTLCNMLGIQYSLWQSRALSLASLPGAAHRSNKVLLFSKKWYFRFSWISLKEARERYLQMSQNDVNQRASLSQSTKQSVVCGIDELTLAL